ncbi:MAG: HslU--HslV peptidase proteolytic subunit, partial [Chromatiales bacterium]|nr:HslU--HslV peptidase proteolytic subunit [Chromatiales bacterium]
TDRMLRRLEAMLLVADPLHSLLLTGNGDVLEPEREVIAIGSGAGYAQAAALALVDETDLNAQTIVERSLGIAADICVFTNRSLTIECLDITT